MTNLTLDQLMAGIADDESLEKEASENEAVTTEEATPSAGDLLAAALTKEAADKKDDKEDKADEKDEDSKEDSKKDSKDEKKTKPSDEEKPEMKKEAQEKGVAIADLIIANLTKQANEIQDQSEGLVADQDSETEATPKGKVNDVVKAIQERGKKDAVDVGGHDIAEECAKEGNDLGEAPEANSDIEKAAAVSHLVNDGISYEDAVTLVKQASEEIEAEELEHIKVAAVNELMAQGASIEDAVNAVVAHLDSAE